MYQESEVIMNKEINELAKTINSNDLILVGGRPATGKTFFSLKLASEIASENNKKILFFNFESSPEFLYSRIKERLNDSYLNENLNIINGLDTKSMNDIKKFLKESKDIDIVIIDYIELLEIRFNIQESNDVLRELKSIAIEYNVPIIILSHLRKEADGIKPRLEHLQNVSIDVNIPDRIIFTYIEHSFNVSK